MIDQNSVLQVQSAGDLPLHCVVNLKAGSTFLRNLFHVLAHGELYTDPNMIHESEHQVMQSLSIDELAHDISFFVIRNPIDRFFSLYFDKIISAPPRNFPWVTARMAKNWTFHAGPKLTIEQHRENCLSLISFIKFRFNMHPMDAVNPHWKPQTEVVKRAIKFGLTPLLQENLSAQLIQISGDRIPGLDDAIALVGHRNKSTRTVFAKDILTPRIRRLISELYEADVALYKLLKSGWTETGQPPDLTFLMEQ
ncbi:MAG: sulfotransferase family 2 domain-containing protein [Rhodobacteraceae bacterium]|nr:sulfotransferase family 2 domain-containing protein [Paracoccaceae bacterium]